MAVARQPDPRAYIPPGTRVLVLEDDAMVADLLTDMLGGFGCTIIGPCASADAALPLIDCAGPAIALLDVHLGPGRDGYVVADALAARDVPFAFVTGNGGLVHHPRHADRPVLQKPFHMTTLIHLVGALARAAA